ncbi:MAG: flagellar export protein FliJ [Sterolibacteriaceae bacterium]|uniref:Flagellar FliJ protein n=1 Tax=Candidatus Methylophosphatis roskildensis TaxID=2899263 RepID=A0A9D7E1W3_9PROT|nr:flagellar export protein FliJ [Candidatus Methylophosphatis roskildensis]
MSHSRFPLETLLELAQSRADDAAKRLGQLIAAQSEDSRKLELLQQYRADYQGRFVAHARSGMRPEEWANYQSFLAKLDEAIEHQSRICQLAQNRTVAGQKSFVEQRNRHKAFDTLAQRHESEEVRRATRQEQKSADEHAAKHFKDKLEDSMDTGGTSLADRYNN